MINNNGLLLEEHYESLNDGDLTLIGLQPKMDCCGIWTEGWGHAMVYKGSFLKGIANKTLAYSLSTIKTKEQADAQLQIDNQTAELFVHRNLTVNVNDNLYAALVCHTMNTGGSKTLISLVNTNDPSLYDWWTTHYVTGQGVHLLGLVYRRRSEAILATKGIIQFFNK
jgi:lysozyme